MDAFSSGAVILRERFIERVQAADKVVIDGMWFALVDGALVVGPTHGATMYLNEAERADEAERFAAAVGPERFERAERRAELMLGAVAHAQVTSQLVQWVDNTGVVKNPVLAGISTAPLDDARAFAAGLGDKLEG